MKTITKMKLGNSYYRGRIGWPNVNALARTKMEIYIYFYMHTYTMWPPFRSNALNWPVLTFQLVIRPSTSISFATRPPYTHKSGGILTSYMTIIWLTFISLSHRSLCRQFFSTIYFSPRCTNLSSRLSPASLHITAAELTLTISLNGGKIL